VARYHALMILAIDQSLTGTGVCRINSDGSFQTALIKTKADLPWFERMEKIIAGIDSLFLDSSGNKPEHIVMENYAFGGSFKGFVLGELGGVIKYHYGKLGYTVHQIVPAHHKQYVTLVGNADKEQVMSALRERFSISVSNDNIADAISMGLLFHSMLMHERGELSVAPFYQNLYRKVRMTLNGERVTKRKKRKVSPRMPSRRPKQPKDSSPKNTFELL
jgi:Holliday junction resolvasome RuvABC endonuclease subunit